MPLAETAGQALCLPGMSLPTASRTQIYTLAFWVKQTPSEVLVALIPRG